MQPDRRSTRRIWSLLAGEFAAEQHASRASRAPASAHTNLNRGSVGASASGRARRGCASVQASVRNTPNGGRVDDLFGFGNASGGRVPGLRPSDGCGADGWARVPARMRQRGVLARRAAILVLIVDRHVRRRDIRGRSSRAGWVLPGYPCRFVSRAPWSAPLWRRFCFQTCSRRARRAHGRLISSCH